MIAILVEGHSDAGFVEGICRSVGVICKAYVLRGNKPDKAVKKVKALAKRFRAILILKDVHMLKRDVLNRFGDRVYRDLKDLVSSGISVKILRVVTSIESWILACLCEENPEAIHKPEIRLSEKLNRPIVKSYDEYRKLVNRIEKEGGLNCGLRNSESFKNSIDTLLSFREG